MKKFIACILAGIFLSACGNNPEIELIELLEPVGVTYDTFIVAREDFIVAAMHPAYVVCHNEPLFFTTDGLPVKSIDVSIGQYVKEGDPLVTLNTENIDKRIESQEERIKDMEIRNAFARRQRELDVMIAALELAEARRTGSDQDIKRREFNLERLSLELRHLEENQELEMSRQYKILNDLKAMLQNTVLIAPFDGRVVSILTRESSWPRAFVPIVYLADETRLQVLYTGRESMTSARDARVTGRVIDRDYDLRFLPLPMDELLRYVLSGTTPPGHFEILNPDEHIKPGQFVRLSIVTREEPDALVVPVNSIYRGEAMEGAYVYVIEDGYRIPRSVVTGFSNASHTIIRSGLEEGERVFVKQ